MLDNVIYEQNDKKSGYKILDTEDPTLITNTNVYNDIINATNVTEIVTYYRI
jgi:hypothetical protein